MLWEMLYCVVFFILPLVGMFGAIVVKAFGGNADEEAVEIEEVVDHIVENVNDIRAVVGGNRGRRCYCERMMRPRESFEQGALVIDFYAYREMGVIRILKRRMYARDGPKDTS